jgi:hypothetical protein
MRLRVKAFLSVQECMPPIRREARKGIACSPLSGWGRFANAKLSDNKKKARNRAPRSFAWHKKKPMNLTG